MRKALLVVLGIIAYAALASRRLARRVRLGATPRYPCFEAPDFECELFEVETEDGVTLRGKRYPNPGRTPVILMHGFTGNCFNFDLAYEKCNFALYLARRGYDVWITNFRGAGREPYKSDGGYYSYSIEDLVVYDVPAIVKAVSEKTGRKPVWIGHSLGAVSAYGYLQGVTYDREGCNLRVKPDPELSSARNDELAALVSVAGPTCFRWPRDCRFFWIVNPVTRKLVRAATPAATALARSVPRVPIEQFATVATAAFPRLSQALFKAGISFFVNVKNMTDDTFREMMLSGSSDVSMTEFLQMMDVIVVQDFTERTAGGGGGTVEPYNFTNSMDMISLPVSFVTGDRDPVNHKVVYETGFKVVSSEEKDFRCFPDFSHIDLLMAEESHRTVFPYVADWLDRVVGSG